jgi:hypothetical protein
MTTLLYKLDSLTTAGSGLSLEWGWIANDYISNVFQEEDSPYRTVLSESLYTLSDRYKNIINRTTIADRVRITRYFTRDRYEELPGHTSYAQIRVCFVADKNNWPEVDKELTEANISWAIENSKDGVWPTPEQIKRKGLPENDPQTRNRKRAVRACSRVCTDGLQPKIWRDATRNVAEMESE